MKPLLSFEHDIAVGSISENALSAAYHRSEIATGLHWLFFCPNSSSTQIFLRECQQI
jgi:hypothetical protein